MRVLTQSEMQLKLDANDSKILSLIKDNVRQPLTKIAEKCRLSRQSVEYRMKQMQKQQLITGSRTVINIRKLGYKAYHIFLEIRTPHEEKLLLERAKKADYVNAIILYSGKYNLEISVLAENEEKFLGYYSQLVRGISIRKELVLVLLNTIAAKVLPEKYLRNIQENEIVVIKSKEGAVDEKDLHLLYLLSNDALKINLALSKELKLSKDAVKYRIKQLEQKNFILQYRPVINYSALGLLINAVLIKLSYDPEEEKIFETFLKSEPSVLWSARCFSHYNYLIYIITRNLDEFHQITNKMKDKFAGIKTYEILFAYEELKYDFMSRNILENYKTEAVK